jgi:hypothetical protein
MPRQDSRIAGAPQGAVPCSLKKQEARLLQKTGVSQETQVCSGADIAVVDSSNAVVVSIGV